MNCSVLALTVALTVTSPVFASENDPKSADIIIVTAPRLTATDEARGTEDELSTGPDGAGFIARQPGAALVANGALSGQVQMRGLFGERILLRINGQHFATGGPNAMDPAMHYAPTMLIDRIEIARGISPVRDGPGLGGGVNTILKHTRFSDSSNLSPQVDVSSQYRSVDDSVAAGGMLGLASDTVRIGMIGSFEKGDDLRFPNGRVASTSFERAVYGVHGGFRDGSSELSIEYRRQDTGRSGNPPFAMDIVYFKTDFARVGYEGDLRNDVRLEAHANYSAVDHRMNNYELRPAPASAMTRQSDTYANTMGADAAIRFGTSGRHIRIGADFKLVDKGYMLYNPLAPTFFIHPLDRAKSERVGAFIEWRSGFGQIESELGLRVDRHRASTQIPRYGLGVPAGPVNLANAFAAADRNWLGTSVDATLRLWADMGALTPRLTLARKTRAPSLVERFSWLPTEASGGLADGNIYVGSTNVKIEKAWVGELGFDWQGDDVYARPVIFFRRIDDFIQGVPFDSSPGVINTPVEMVAAASGDPTPLRFANTEATIWGTDVAFGTKLIGSLRLDGVASYVRAKRRDITDNLYRIAPANGRLAIGWDASRWSLSLEGQFVAKQSKVSMINNEASSKGHALANLYGHWLIREGVRLDLGIENLFNTYFLEHLAGYNRITGSDVALGSRVPGARRSGFVRIRWAI
jgi:iron complex outermembrane receptor protein